MMKSAYKIHKYLQTIAFLFLFPLGILVAIFRNAIGPTWLMWHITFQALATIAVFTAVFIMVRAHRHDEDEKEAPNNKKKIHKIFGPLVVLAIILQWLWAFGGRRLLGMNTWQTWYMIHILLATSIVVLGWTNLYIGYTMHKS